MKTFSSNPNLRNHTSFTTSYPTNKLVPSPHVPHLIPLDRDNTSTYTRHNLSRSLFSNDKINDSVGPESKHNLSKKLDELLGMTTRSTLRHRSAFLNNKELVKTEESY